MNTIRATRAVLNVLAGVGRYKPSPAEQAIVVAMNNCSLAEDDERLKMLYQLHPIFGEIHKKTVNNPYWINELQDDLADALTNSYI